jgi:YidC/Oxa1 family membrane protein insertase
MQKQMGNLQPRMQEIQEKYKNDPQKMYEETMKVFKTDGMGPLKGCLGILIQAPVFIGLYRVIQNFAMNGIQEGMVYSFLSSFVIFAQPEHLVTTFLGADLLVANNRFLAALA